MAAISITTEMNPSPLVKIFATKFRKAAQQNGYIKRLNSATGCFALKSSTDPQALTITISPASVYLQSGISQSADIVITLNFDDPDAAPTITRLWRHPLYAMAVGKLLTFPTAHWTDAMKRFWDQYQDFPDMPTGIKVHCDDENRDFYVGNEDAEMFLSGKSSDIAEVFSGDTALFDSLSKHKLLGKLSFQHAVVVSDITLQMMLGEAP